MAQNSRRRNALIALAIVVIVIILLLLLTRCPRPAAPTRESAAPPAPTTTSSAQPAGQPPPSAEQPAEVLTAATLTVPERVAAGAVFSVGWTGPDNQGDFVTIVKPEASANTTGNYRETREGESLDLTAPIDPGPYEVRYVTARSRTILGRAAVEVEPVTAALDAPPEVVLGATFSVTWTGPANTGDYITIVPAGAPDEQFGSYTDTSRGSPLNLTAPVETGDAEVRYVSGQGRKVLARRPIRIIAADVSLSASPEAIAGTTIEVTWTGPNNAGDYVTLVPVETPDGQYGNYTNTATGSPLKLLTPIMAGDAELRYMTGQGNRVLARRPIKMVAAQVALAADPECAAGAPVTVTWTGPNNPGDYITVVAKVTPDGQYAAYTNTAGGSPLTVNAPKEAGEAEIRYMTGQGNKVLARIPIKVVP